MELMTQKEAKSYIGKTLDGELVEDVGKTKRGWIAYFSTPEGTRWNYLQSMIENTGGYGPQIKY
jgi:hypothetical protein